MRLNDLEIKSVSILRRAGFPDSVFVMISGLKAPIWPYDQPLVMSFEASPGTGQRFVSEHFGILAEVING